MAKGLTKKQEKFIAEYLKDLNASRAAVSAGYSKKGASVTGSQLLANPKIAPILAEKFGKTIKKLDISSEDVLIGLKNLAFFDARKLYNEDGTLKLMHELDFDTQAGLTGIEIEKLYEHFGKGKASETGTVTKVRWIDRGQNLERLGRYFKLFTEKLEVSGSVSIADRIAKGRQRVAERS